MFSSYEYNGMQKPTLPYCIAFANRLAITKVLNQAYQ